MPEWRSRRLPVWRPPHIAHAGHDFFFRFTTIRGDRDTFSSFGLAYSLGKRSYFQSQETSAASSALPRPVVE